MFDQYADYEYRLAQIQLVCFMLGMGATLMVADFVEVLRRPKFLIVGAAGQFLLTPLVALGVSRLLRVEEGIGVGMILVSAMPGGTLSKLFTYLGSGNLALSITLTAVGTLGSIVTVPLLLRLLTSGYDITVPVDHVVRDVALYLLLPLLAGMMFGRWRPAWKVPFSRWCVRAGFLFVLTMILGSLGSGRIHPGEYGWKAPLAIILFCVLAQQLSMLPFRILRWPKPDCLSVGIEVTMRNLNLALLLNALIFPAIAKGTNPIADGVLFVILFYAGVALAAGFPLSMRYRWMARRAARAAVVSP